MEACTQIVDNINLIQNRLLYRDLMKKCYFIHFEEDELKNINDSYEKDDNLFIFSSETGLGKESILKYIDELLEIDKKGEETETL